MGLKIRYTCAADGSRVAYAVSGHGPDLVHMPFPFGVRLAHAGTEIFDTWFEPLAARFRLIRYEGRGVGLGERNVSSLTAGDMLRDLEAVLKAAGVGERFYLFASYQYANAALQFAVDYPEAVLGLVLWVPNVVPPASAPSNHIAEQDWLLYLRNIATANHFVRNEHELRLEVGDLSRSMDQEDYLALLRGFESGPSGTDLLPRVAAPTLLLKPRDLVLRYPSDPGNAAMAMANARVEIVEGSSVCPIDVQAGPTLAALDNFVAECGGPEPLLPPPSRHVLLTLSQREHDVLRLLARGQSNADIAARFTLSTRTVERHVQNIYAKVGVHNRVEAANWAREHGVV